MTRSILLLSALPLLWGAAKHTPLELRGELTVEVDLSTRRLVVTADGRQLGAYDIAIGKPGHLTPVGTYKMSRVVWNPSWVPPKEEWADTASPKEPGERGNPMGRVKILFDSELYIHGTTDKESLGDPASHGCIRMSNAAAMQLGRLVMEHGGASRPEKWYATMQTNPTESLEGPITNPPVLRIKQ
jgi:murein L,D-transpeptidase YcbB/YkuD